MSALAIASHRCSGQVHDDLTNAGMVPMLPQVDALPSAQQQLTCLKWHADVTGLILSRRRGYPTGVLDVEQAGLFDGWGYRREGGVLDGANYRDSGLAVRILCDDSVYPYWRFIFCEKTTMTEYELVDAIASYASGGGTFFTIWLTILSAYGITAYATGRNLTSFQVVWLNTLYLFAAALAIFGFYGQFNSQIFYIHELRLLRPESPQIMNADILLAVTLVAVMGTVVTLLFMWQIRHSQSD